MGTVTATLDALGIKQETSSLVFADSRIKFHFSFTRDSYKGFFLHHGSFSYVTYCVKVEGFLTANDREKAACKGECEARRKSAEGRVCLRKAHRRHLLNNCKVPINLCHFCLFVVMEIN